MICEVCKKKTETFADNLIRGRACWNCIARHIKCDACGIIVKTEESRLWYIARAKEAIISKAARLQ